MFSIGFAEFLVIVIVVIVTMDVKKVPEYLKLLRSFYLKAKLLQEEIINYFLEEENYHITGDDGKIHKVYPLEPEDPIKEEYFSPPIEPNNDPSKPKKSSKRPVRKK